VTNKVRFCLVRVMPLPVHTPGFLEDLLNTCGFNMIASSGSPERCVCVCVWVIILSSTFVCVWILITIVVVLVVCVCVCVCV